MPERSAKDATGQKRSWTSLRMSAINTLCPVRPGMPWFCSLTFLLLLLRTDLTVPSIPSVGWDPGCACGTAHCSSTTPYNDGRDPLVDPLPAWVKGDRPTTHTQRDTRTPFGHLGVAPPSQTNKQTVGLSSHLLGSKGGILPTVRLGPSRRIQKVNRRKGTTGRPMWKGRARGG